MPTPFRRGWPRRLLRGLPRRSNLSRYPIIKHLAPMAKRAPWLWSWRMPALISAIWVGFLISWAPLVGVQIPLAFVGAVLFRANLTITAGLQMISNPITLAPMYYASYRVGAAILYPNVPEVGLDDRVIATCAGGALLGSACAIVAHAALLVHARVTRRGFA